MRAQSLRPRRLLAARHPRRPRHPSPPLRAVTAAWAVSVSCLVLLVLSGPAPARAQSSPQHNLDDLARSVVGIAAEIPPDARTAARLGTRRVGSGVVIDNAGHVVTIGYLILEADKVTVVRGDGEEFQARVLGYDAESGFGLVQVSGELGVTPMTLGDSDGLAVQEPVLLLTRSGMEGAASATVVSRRTFAGYWEYLLENAIFTTPPQGDYAGAALVDRNLRLVGIGSLYVENAASEGMQLPGNMFVPIARLKPILRDLVEAGRPRTRPRPWLGINVGEQFGRVIVTRVTPQGPARESGLHPGDILLEIAGQKIQGIEHFYRQLWALGEAGIAVKLRVLQRSDLVALTVNTRDRYGHYRSAPAR